MAKVGIIGGSGLYHIEGIEDIDEVTIVDTPFGQPSDNFAGGAYAVSYTHSTRSHNWYLDYQQITPDFRSDLGFMFQVDYRNISGGLSRLWYRKPGSWFSRIGIGSSYTLEKDHDNNLLFKALVFQLNYTGPLQTFFNVTGNIGKRGFRGLEFDENYIYAELGFIPSNTLAFMVTTTYGDQIDLTNIQPGELFNFSPTIRMKIGTHLALDLTHEFEKLEVQGGRLYTANLTNLRIVYQFNKRTFLRTMLQYANYKFDANLYPYPINPRYRHLFSQILFSYKINHQTVLFIGYSDDHYGYMGIPITQNNRTAFVKLGYALRL